MSLHGRLRVSWVAVVLGVAAVCPAAAQSDQDRKDSDFLQFIADFEAQQEVPRPWPDVADGRQMSLYDDGGEVDFGRWSHMEGESADEHWARQRRDLITIRAFLRDHWRRHRLGTVRILTASVDAAATTHYFVEPGPDGRWRIAIRVDHGGGRIHDVPSAYSVERGIVDPHDGSAVLVLRDRHGEVIESL